MGRVEEIQEAIDRLPPDEFRRIARRVHEREQELWDEELDRDAASGVLDFLLEEAEGERREGSLREWPPAK